jgi:hypothetical protein
VPTESVLSGAGLAASRAADGMLRAYAGRTAYLTGVRGLREGLRELGHA